MKTFKYYIFKLLNFLKRFFYFFTLLGKKFLAGINWLVSSNEHTAFTVYLNEQDKKDLVRELACFLDIETSNVLEKINFASNLKLDEILNISKTTKYVDIDLKPKFDYRLIPFIIFFEKEISNLYEFGFNQGRIPFLIHQYMKSSNINNLNNNYIGIDINSRKGAFCNYINANEFKFIYDDVSNFLKSNSEETKFNESCIVATTHEQNSEKAIFDFLFKNKITPKFIISDNVDSNSHFINFLNSYEKYYKTKVFKFSDSKRFLEDSYIALAVRI